MSAPRHLERLVLTSFLATFACARILVFLIMSHGVPDLYLHLGGTHVHHLNYGIFLLSIIGAILLFGSPTGRALDLSALAYGVGLALTFDEFGMWLHLGGAYWQRASFDAVTVIASILLLAAFTPPLKYWTVARVARAIGLAIVVGVFFWRLFITLRPVEHRIAPRFKSLEQQGPS
jgi:hypothetical protein